MVFDREAPFELRILDSSRKTQVSEVGKLEAIRIRVFVNVSKSF